MTERTYKLINIRPYIQLDEFSHPAALDLVSRYSGKALSALCAGLLERGARSLIGGEAAPPYPAPVPANAQPAGPSTSATGFAPPPAGLAPVGDLDMPIIPADAMSDFLSLPQAHD